MRVRDYLRKTTSCFSRVLPTHKCQCGGDGNSRSSLLTPLSLNVMSNWREQGKALCSLLGDQSHLLAYRMLTGSFSLRCKAIQVLGKEWDGKNGMERRNKKSKNRERREKIKKSEEERLHLKKYLVNTMRWWEPDIEMTEWARSLFNQLWKEMPCLEWMGLIHPVCPLQNPVSRCQRDPQYFKYPVS